MNWQPATRIESVQTPVIPTVGQWITEHPGTISLGQGIVHYPPPPGVSAAVAAAAEQLPVSRYCAVQGIPELHERIRHKLETENGMDPSRASVLCTAGSNMGFINALIAIADPGDEIILLSPYYFNHEMAVDIAACKSVVVPTDAQGQVDLQQLADAVTRRTRAIVTVSPNNPAGVVYPRESLIAINELCRKHGIFHISDEAYEYFVYEGEHFSPASLPGAAAHTISLFSLSKSYGMAGWRVAYMVVPAGLELAVKKAQDTNLVCPPVISQIAGVAALRAGRPWVAQQSAEFMEVRDLVVERMRSLGDRVVVPEPQGAFYCMVYTNSSQLDMELVRQLIRDFGVATLPGGTFGIEQRCAIRVAYGALSKDSVATGMDRLVNGLNQLL